MTSREMTAERDRLAALLHEARVADGWLTTVDVHRGGDSWEKRLADRLIAAGVGFPTDLAARIEELHQPTEGLGYREDDSYGHMEPVCSVCGTADEYGVPWPCATVLLVREEAARVPYEYGAAGRGLNPAIVREKAAAPRPPSRPNPSRKQK